VSLTTRLSDPRHDRASSAQG